MTNQPWHSHPIQRRAKRLIDVGVALTGLIVASPIISAEAIAIRLTMGRPILFRQVRPGRDEALFQVVKFRTMLPERDPEGIALAPAERVTRLGWFLRRTSLDELPQLWSVLRGDISLVGPRPLLVDYLPFYSERERLRHSVPPGITGLAQINGRNLLSWDERLELDVRYVESWTIWQDLRILLKTFTKVARSSGVARDPSHEGALDVLRRVQVRVRTS
jgi:lipopolysaccharide/colanic/teichoic acid biosynthesis glycosyltransferase